MVGFDTGEGGGTGDGEGDAYEGVLGALYARYVVGELLGLDGEVLEGDVDSEVTAVVVEVFEVVTAFFWCGVVGGDAEGELVDNVSGGVAFVFGGCFAGDAVDRNDVCVDTGDVCGVV